MGPAERNPGGVVRAVVDIGPDGCAVVGFEDLFGGGDRDYDDNRFRFCGGIVAEPPDPGTDPSRTPSHPPDADAGPDQAVAEGSVVTLNALSSLYRSCAITHGGRYVVVPVPVPGVPTFSVCR